MENTGSALAEDVIQKSEIIKSYFMANKAGEMGVVLVRYFINSDSIRILTLPFFMPYPHVTS